jgi:DNA-binding response OmpR family regulator
MRVMQNKQSKKTILIVEDEVSLQNALAEKLNREGFDTLCAGDGQEGISIANSSHPDLILLDIKMPKMDGITMLQKLRHDSKWGQDVAVILLTNSAPDEDMPSLNLDNGQLPDYLVKSNWSLTTVVEKIRERLASQ